MTCYSPNMRAEATCSKPENSCQSHAKVMRGVVLASCRNSSPPKKKDFPKKCLWNKHQKHTSTKMKEQSWGPSMLVHLTETNFNSSLFGSDPPIKETSELGANTSTLVSVCLGGCIGKTIWGMIINYRSLSVNTLPPLQFHVHIYI